MIIEKDNQILTLSELEKISGAKWIPTLDFEDSTPLVKMGAKLHKKGEMTYEQMWLGTYFRKEILYPHIPDVVIRWINAQVGWGVFANRNFKKMEFIAEYAGKVRKRKKEDSKNAYCFEYVIVQGFDTSFTIDAQDQSGIGRYINHSSQPNLQSTLATFDNLSHVILITKEPIAKNTQLCFDYGLDYWSKRTAPVLL